MSVRMGCRPTVSSRTVTSASVAWCAIVALLGDVGVELCVWLVCFWACCLVL